jgi:hydroxymethylpyrimidine pyrophosphatase-like HAD family hydrolase
MAGVLTSGEPAVWVAGAAGPTVLDPGRPGAVADRGFINDSGHLYFDMRDGRPVRSKSLDAGRRNLLAPPARPRQCSRPMGDVGLVVTDLDGTLWHDDADLHPDTVAAVHELAARGVPLLVATGRRLGSTRAPLALAGFSPPVVVLNGTLGVDLASGRRFHTAPFAAADAAAVLDAFRSAGIEPCVYVDDPDIEVVLGRRPSTNPGHVEMLGADAVVGDLDAAVRERPVLAFSVIGVPHTMAVAAHGAIGADVALAYLDRALSFGGMAAVTVGPRDRSKWDGVLAFCAREGLDPDRVLAIGDGPNDTELLRRAAVSVAPENGHPEALALAQHTVPAPTEGGWAKLLDLLG